MKKHTYSYIAAIIILGFIAFSSVFTTPTPSESSLNSEGSVVVGITSLRSLPLLAAIGGVDAREIAWETSKSSKDVSVNINLIQKVSDSPTEFKFVRSIAYSTTNDGRDIWFPAKSDTSSDLYLEVTCSDTANLPEGCSVASLPLKVN